MENKMSKCLPSHDATQKWSISVLYGLSDVKQKILLITTLVSIRIEQN